MRTSSLAYQQASGCAGAYISLMRCFPSTPPNRASAYVMSGRSSGTAIACPSYGAAPYNDPSCTLSALTCSHSASEGPKTCWIGNHASWLTTTTTAMVAHPTGSKPGQNRFAPNDSAAAATRMPAKTYGNAKTRVTGIHHTQLAREGG